MNNEHILLISGWIVGALQMLAICVYWSKVGPGHQYAIEVKKKTQHRTERPHGAMLTDVSRQSRVLGRS